ncbi:MAG: hypothetical protein A2Y61_00385 [Chloroflexi bacterium RBG_13_60_13]|nr:MAG: hypothetical protein A2Y61_00385 [Chloroflexi bacterium RBG_13_60_13]
MSTQVNLFPCHACHETGYPDKHLVVTSEAFERMTRFLACSPVVVFDFETSGLQWFREARSCGLALAGWDGSSEIHHFYTPYRHRTGEPQLDMAMIGPAFKQLLGDESKIKVAHHLKFDEHFARREGWQVRGPRYDTMIAARLYDENRPLALKYRAKADLGRDDADEWERRVDAEVVKLARIQRMGKKEYVACYRYCQVAVPVLGTYACFDAGHTAQLYIKYERAKLSQLYPRIWNTEMQLIEVLTDMEEMGLPVDVAYLENLRDTLTGMATSLELEIERILGRRSNLRSDDELRDLLTGTLGFTLDKLTKGKALSVDREVLESFEDRHPVMPLIMKWRDAEKLANTYTTSILQRLDAQNILHADFQQAGTNTGRMACREPNFQNQPTDDDTRAVEYTGLALEDGGTDPWSIRRAFVNRGPGWVRLFFDFSQIELRVLAFYSRDPVMVDNYIRGGDIHERTSLEVFGSKEKKYRRIAKIINFGLSYGLSDLGLRRQAKIPLPEAAKFMATFFKRYAGVDVFRKRFWSQVRAQECQFQNLFGRPRRMPGIVNKSDYHRGRAERQAIASLIQGTAAELTKESLVRIWRRFKAEGLPAWPVNTVHDEIQVDCHVDALVSVCRAMKEEMERFPEFDPIPVVVAGDYTTDSWASKRKLPW